jgi:hypothetical protein
MKTNLVKMIVITAIAMATGLCQALALDGEVVVNNSVASDSLDAAALKDILTGKTAYWPGGDAVVIVIVPDKTDAALEQASGMNSGAFKTFWQRLAFSGRGQQPKTADDGDKAVALVSSTKGAIAIVPSGTKLDGVKKVTVK